MSKDREPKGESGRFIKKGSVEWWFIVAGMVAAGVNFAPKVLDLVVKMLNLK